MSDSLSDLHRSGRLPAATGKSQRSAVEMSSAEIEQFLSLANVATASTIRRDGLIHSVAMNYAYVDGVVYLETKRRSQKVANLRLDERLTVLIHDGTEYHELRGVMLAGRAAVLDDAGLLDTLAGNILLRYFGVSNPSREAVLQLVRNRVAVRVEPVSTVSWDHRKLGLPS